jgi:hypothetical protein
MPVRETGFFTFLEVQYRISGLISPINIPAAGKDNEEIGFKRGEFVAILRHVQVLVSREAAVHL